MAILLAVLLLAITLIWIISSCPSFIIGGVIVGFLLVSVFIAAPAFFGCIAAIDGLEKGQIGSILVGIVGIALAIMVMKAFFGFFGLMACRSNLAIATRQAIAIALGLT